MFCEREIKIRIRIRTRGRLSEINIWRSAARRRELKEENVYVNVVHFHLRFSLLILNDWPRRSSYYANDRLFKYTKMF